MENTIANSVSLNLVGILYRGVPSKIYYRAVHSYSFSYAHKKSMAFRISIFREFTNAQQQDVHIAYTSFSQIGHKFNCAYK